MVMEIITVLIKDLGFPIFVSAFLLIRLDRQMTKILCELKKINGKGGDK